MFSEGAFREHQSLRRSAILFLTLIDDGFDRSCGHRLVLALMRILHESVFVGDSPSSRFSDC